MLSPENQPKLSISTVANLLNISKQAVHKQLKNKGITCPTVGNRSFITYDISKQFLNLSFKPKIVAVQIVKGGTGKTTTVENVASCANALGARVLKIDADAQANLTDTNGVDSDLLPVLIDVLHGEAQIEQAIVNVAPGVDLLPSRIENVVLDNVIVNDRHPLHTLYENLLHSVAKDYDFIFIDCPPTMGQSVTAASLYADLILAPLNPDKYSAKGLKILKQEITALNRKYKREINFKVFLNKFSSKTILSDKALISLISDHELDGHVLSPTIQHAQEIPNLADANKNLFCNVRESQVRDDFINLTTALLEIDVTSINVNG